MELQAWSIKNRNNGWYTITNDDNYNAVYTPITFGKKTKFQWYDCNLKAETASVSHESVKYIESASPTF